MVVSRGGMVLVMVIKGGRRDGGPNVLILDLPLAQRIFRHKFEVVLVGRWSVGEW